MDRCFIKYLPLVFLFISIDVFACRLASLQTTKTDILNQAMEKSSIVAIATVEKFCIKSDCGEDYLTINIDSFYKGDAAKIIDVFPGRNSCDVGQLHPTKLKGVHGMVWSSVDYRVGEKYLVIINEHPSLSPNNYLLRAGEKLGRNTAYYTNIYSQ